MSKKKVLVLLGSPRKEGSSASLARCLAEGAQSAGAEVEEVVIQTSTSGRAPPARPVTRKGRRAVS